MLFEISSEFNLKQEQLISTVTDNASNFVKAFKEFGISCPDFDLDNEGKYHPFY